MNRWIAATSLLFSVDLVAGSASAPLQLPDPSTGVIDGRDAVVVWPARYRDAQSHELLPAEGCEVHLVRSTDLDTELVRPCGQWLVPDPGKYKVWLQGNDFINPEPMILNAVLGSTGRGRSVATPAVPSRTIVLSSDVRLCEYTHDPAEVALLLCRFPVWCLTNSETPPVSGRHADRAAGVAR